MNRKFKDLKELSSQVREPFTKDCRNIFKYWRKDEIELVKIKYIKNIPVAYACLVNLRKRSIWDIDCMLIIGCLPKYRRKGIVTSLMESLLKEAKNKKLSIAFHVLRDNKASNAFFQNLSEKFDIQRCPEWDFWDENSAMEDIAYKFNL